MRLRIPNPYGLGPYFPAGFLAVLLLLAVSCAPEAPEIPSYDARAFYDTEQVFGASFRRRDAHSDDLGPDRSHETSMRSRSWAVNPRRSRVRTPTPTWEWRFSRGTTGFCSPPTRAETS